MDTHDADDVFMCLYEAFEAGENEIIYMIFDNGFEIPENKKMISLLGLAASHGNAELISYLLDKKILNVNEQDSLYNYTALHRAAMTNHDIVAQILLSYNADPNVQCSKGYTPLHIAVQRNHFAIAEALIASGRLDINVQDACGNTALHEASCRGYALFVKLFVSNNANVNITNARHETALHLASSCNRANIVEFLIKNKAKINSKDFQQNTPLHRAAATSNNLETVKILTEYILNKKLNIDERNRKNETALHLALINRNPDVANFLIESGSFLLATNNQGITPRELIDAYPSKIPFSHLYGNDKFTIFNTDKETSRYLDILNEDLRKK